MAKNTTEDWLEPEAALESAVADDRLLRAAEERLKRGEPARKDVKDRLARGEYTVDSADRLKARVKRILGDPLARRGLRQAGLAPPVEGVEIGAPEEALLLERVIGDVNFLGVSFFDLGRRAAQAVGRIEVRSPTGRSGSATGSLVSPRLLLTNHHVLPDRAWAAASRVVFDHEDDPAGAPRPTVTFALDPDSFFLASESLDFALVAVAERALIPAGAALADYGHNPLDPEQGKITVGESINIIQHPGGLPKQVAIQDNRLLDLPEDWLHYESDTLPGSSGAPLFNNRWELVGLHHAGWPARDGQGRILTPDGRVWDQSMGETAVHWLGNEGARVSRIVAVLQAARAGLPDPERALLDALLSPAHRGTVVEPAGEREAGGIGRSTGRRIGRGEPDAGAAAAPRAAVPAPFTTSADGAVDVTVPLHLSLRLGEGRPLGAGLARRGPGAAAGLDLGEKLLQPWIDTRYSNRRGYRRDFLGIDLPMPTLRDATIVATMANGESAIPYQHFSVTMHKDRRLALFAAANVSGRATDRSPDPDQDYSRKALGGLGKSDIEKWKSEDRIAGEHQLPDAFFTRDRQAFDKGHIIRREDVCWGRSFAQLRRANGDTYHTTNCSPQVGDFNQSSKSGLWGKLENHILKQLKEDEARYCIFAGPVLADDDEEFEGVDDWGPVTVQIPQRYWKMVCAPGDRGLEAYAFVLEQDLSGVKFRAEEFAAGAEWREHMIRVNDLEDLIRWVRFDQQVHDADQAGHPRGDELLRLTELELK